jgi:alkaline phosphatase
MSASLSSSAAIDEDGPFYMPDMSPFYINWTTAGHTAVDVPVTSGGPLSESLIGLYQNTYIFDTMKLHLQ